MMSAMHRLRIVVVSAVALVALPTELLAQCALSASTLTGLDGPVSDSANWDPDGAGPLPPRVVVVGTFTVAGGLTANGVAACDPQTGNWSVFGSGVSGTVTGVVGLPGGQFAVTGMFASAGGVPATNIAVWTGTAWSALGAGVPPWGSLAATPNGELLVAHSNTVVSRWDGVGWTTLGSAAPGRLLAVAANGDVMVGGTNGIWRWTGTVWQSYAGGVSDVLALAPLPDGRFFAAVVIPFQSTYFAVFNGTTWTTLGGTLVNAYYGPVITDVAVLPDGNPAVSGIFAVSSSLPAVGHFVRWNGSTWTALGANPAGPGHITTLTFTPRGQLFAGGNQGSYLGRLVPTCPAQEAPAGAGCASSGGANVLAVEALPWVGGKYRARATGLPAFAFVTKIYGFSPINLPLASVLPQGQLGCTLHVSPDFVDASLAVAGTATTELAIPAAAALVGVGFRNQMNVFEFDAAFHFVAITASNALSLTVGAF
jgi:hypothetical protein